MRKKHCFESKDKIGVNWLASRNTLTKGACMLMLACSPNFVHASTNSLQSVPANVEIVQQNQVAKGFVYDSKGEPVIGASVVVKGTTNGTISGLDGDFAINGVSKGAVIQISFIGYKTIEMKWNGTPLKVTLKEDSEMLEEVVVTGYGGKQLRTKVTNSISKVNEEALTVGVHSNPAQALSGAVSGLRVVQTSGNPGAMPSIVLRGGTNLDGTGAPLIMVDGQLRDSLSDINPEDIESIDVLKDAGATALYGARASNGVILVTTKNGKQGRAEVNLKARYGLNYINNPYEFLGARDFLYWMRTAYDISPWAPKGNLTGATSMGTGNKYGDPGMQWNVMGYDAADPVHQGLLQKGWEVMDDPINPGKQLIFKDTNPADFNFNNPATTQDYNVNINGGNDKGTYYAGLGYNKTEGIPVTSFYKRYSFVFNGSYKVTKWLKASSNFNYNRANWNSMPGSQTNEYNYFGRILSVPSTARYQDEDGNYLLGPNAGDGNQLFQPEKWTRDNQSDKFTMIQTIEAQILPNLSVKGTANWYYSESLQEAFTKDFQTNQAGTAFNKTRGSSASFGRDFSQTYNVVVNYNTKIARDHSIDAMVGMEAFDRQSKGFSASGSGAPTDDFADLDYTSTDEKKRSIDSWHSQYRILSYFGRLNYDYKGRYLFSGVFRQDGYSSLIDNRWGFFPGVSVGWIFGQEDFVKKALPFMSFGKLRASYGINGNASGIGAYTLQGSYGNAKYNGNTGFLIGRLPNPGLRWEKTKTFEVGLDMSFFENRLNTNFTYYNRLTSDKYASFSLPSTTGFSSITNNNGEFRNQGVEIELSGNIIKNKEFTWNMKGNIAFNKNKVEKLPFNGLDNNRQGGVQIYTGNGDEKKFVGGYQEGQEPGLFVGYKAVKIFQNDNEINKAYPKGMVTSGNAQGKIQYTPEKWATLTDAERKKGMLITPGDVQWADINGDGMIDSFDQIELGNTTPRWTGGFTSTMTWKGFRLYAAFDYALGFTRYDSTTPWFLGCMQGTYNATKDVFDTWTPENTGAKYPMYVWADQLGKGNYNRTSTLFASNGNYLAFRELSLAYSLPKTIANKMFCQAVELSITGQNLGYLTAGKVARPEVSSSGSGYALPRTLLFGINVKF